MNQENMKEEKPASGASDRSAFAPEGVDVASGRAPEERLQSEQKQATTAADQSIPTDGNQEGVSGAVASESTGEEANEETPTEGEGEQSDLEKANDEIQKLKDAWTRERAEFMNYKKRVAQDQVRARMWAIGDFVGSLLPALDNLETVLKVKTENPEVKNFVTGVEMIRGELISALGKHNIRHLQPLEQPFDPQIMEAIAIEEREGLEAEQVLEVFQDGFFLEFDDGHKQVLRPARVKVGKPVPAPS